MVILRVSYRYGYTRGSGRVAEMLDPHTSSLHFVGHAVESCAIFANSSSAQINPNNRFAITAGDGVGNDWADGGRVRNNEERDDGYCRPCSGRRRRMMPLLVVSSEVVRRRRCCAGNQVLDDVEEVEPALPRALVDVNLRRRRLSTLLADDDDYDDVVDKRYMRFGRRASDDVAAADKRYMRFGRARSHFHPLMGFAKRYMRFGRR